jgi:two-component system cell cycle response regulator CtrA
MKSWIRGSSGIMLAECAHSKQELPFLRDQDNACTSGKTVSICKLGHSPGFFLAAFYAYVLPFQKKVLRTLQQKTEEKIKMRVLMIEDDAACAQSIELMLKTEGFNVYTTDLGEEGVDLAKLYDYDIVLLDLNLPDISGFEVLRQIRVAKVSTPVIIVSGLAGIEDKVKGLTLGADDYLTKPFHTDELVARIRAITRRSRGLAQSIVETGGILVNLDTRTLEINGERVSLSGVEYRMLELFSLRRGATLSRGMFMNHLYGGMDEPEAKIVDVYVCKLRKKIKDGGGDPSIIETIWGQGFLLRDDSKTNTRSPHSGNGFVDDETQAIAVL